MPEYQIARWPRTIHVPEVEVTRAPGDTYIALTGHHFTVAVVRAGELSACGWTGSTRAEVESLTEEQ